MKFLCLLLISRVVKAEPANVTTQSDMPSEVSSDLEKLPVLVKDAVLHYPQAALKEELHGTVHVRVRIGISGKVDSAAVVSGLSIFHEEALIAAKRLVFEPALQNGQKIAVDMIVSFHFAPPHPEPKGDLAHPDHSIVVSAHDLHEQSLHSTDVMNESEVRANRQFDVARTISDVAGVTFSSGSSNNSKPIIRGQTERRLMVLKDGVAHASQKWGVDHAPELDPFSIGAIEVRKGAEAVRFGGDAIGGVLLIQSPTLIQDNGTQGQATSIARSNGQQIGTSLRQDVRHDSIAVRAYGNIVQSADLSTPTYLLGNTASVLWNAGIIGELDTNAGRVWWSLDHFHNTAGVFYGMQASSPEDLLTSIERDRPLDADAWIGSRTWGEPFQRVNHSKGVFKWFHSMEWGSAEVQYAFQRNDRQEKETSRNADFVEPQYNFELLTHTIDVSFDHLDRFIGEAEWDLQWGITGKAQDNLYSGFSLLPNYRQLDMGAFTLSKLIFSQSALHGGLRWDVSFQDAYMAEGDFLRHERYDLLPSDCSEADMAVACSTYYSTGAFVLGGVWQLIPEKLEWRGDVSTGARFPNVDERYLLGTAPSFPVFAMGDPNLPKESVHSMNTTLGFQGRMVSTEVSIFSSWIDNFLYFTPWMNEGSVRTISVIKGTYPVYRYLPTDTHFYGAEGVLRFWEDEPWSTSLTGSTVRAFERSSGLHLIGIPGDSIRLNSGWKTEQVGLSGTLEAVAKQHRVLPSQDFAPAPDGFALIHLQAYYKYSRSEFHLQVRNLTNTRYRRYMSLLRYYADEPGIDVQFSFTQHW